MDDTEDVACFEAFAVGPVLDVKAPTSRISYGELCGRSDLQVVGEAQADERQGSDVASTSHGLQYHRQTADDDKRFL